MKCIVFSRVDGGVSIIHPNSRRLTDLMTSGLSETEALALIQSKALLEARKRPETMPAVPSNAEVMERSDIPGFDAATGVLHHHVFRDALEKPTSGRPVINMPKAREIQAANIQDARRTEIDRLQREEATAQFAGRTADAGQHAADRVALETMDFAGWAARIAGAANPTALKAAWPAGLPTQEN